MGAFLDLTGETFSKLTVLRRAANRKKSTQWECVCACGRSCVVGASDLRKGHTKSCGCHKLAGLNARAIDMSGQRFGKLIAVSKAPAVAGHTYWNCLCDCGSKVTKEASHLREGHTASCGCLRVECGKTKTTHAHTTAGTISPEYRSWAHMIDRCTRESATEYASYGGRGISVCEPWLKFETFLADVGSKPSVSHSIGRINNDGNYEPGNVRWETATQQARNRRSSVFIESDGERLVVSEWAARFRLRPATIHKRLNRGISLADQLFSKQRLPRTPNKQRMSK